MQDAARTIQCGVMRRSLRRSRPPGWLALSLALAAAIPAQVFGAGSTTQPADGERASGQDISVRLHNVAVVEGEAVTLGDIAEVRGDAAGLATSCLITPSPRPGHSLVLGIEDVQKALSDRGANLAYWAFRGSTRCTVTRSAARNNDRKPESARSNTRSEEIPVKASATEKPDAGSVADADSLEGSLTQHIRRRLADLGGTPAIQFPRTASRQLALSKPTYEFQISTRSDQLLGMISFDVTVIGPEQERQTLQVVARISLKKEVAVAARPLNRGKVVEAGDLTLREQVYERVEDIGLPSIAPVVGQQAKRFIDKGEQIRAKDFEPLPLVQRNDLVTVLVKLGNLRVKGTARAMGAGAFGQVIEVRNEMGERSAGRFSAVVVGEKTVEIPDTSRPTTTAPADKG
jgi:flagellar basal body P-ring formation protein FlgA